MTINPTLCQKAQRNVQKFASVILNTEKDQIAQAIGKLDQSERKTFLKTLDVVKNHPIFDQFDNNEMALRFTDKFRAKNGKTKINIHKIRRIKNQIIDEATSKKIKTYSRKVFKNTREYFAKKLGFITVDQVMSKVEHLQGLKEISSNFDSHLNNSNEHQRINANKCNQRFVENRAFKNSLPELEEIKIALKESATSDQLTNAIRTPLAKLEEAKLANIPGQNNFLISRYGKFVDDLKGLLASTKYSSKAKYEQISKAIKGIENSHKKQAEEISELRKKYFKYSDQSKAAKSLSGFCDRYSAYFIDQFNLGKKTMLEADQQKFNEEADTFLSAATVSREKAEALQERLDELYLDASYSEEERELLTTFRGIIEDSRSENSDIANVLHTMLEGAKKTLNRVVAKHVKPLIFAFQNNGIKENRKLALIEYMDANFPEIQIEDLGSTGSSSLSRSSSVGSMSSGELVPTRKEVI